MLASIQEPPNLLKSGSGNPYDNDLCLASELHSRRSLDIVRIDRARHKKIKDR